MTAAPAITTERLILRSLRGDDHPPFAAFLANERTAAPVGRVRDAVAAWRTLATFAGHWPLPGQSIEIWRHPSPATSS